MANGSADRLSAQCDILAVRVNANELSRLAFRAFQAEFFVKAGPFLNRICQTSTLWCGTEEVRSQMLGFFVEPLLRTVASICRQLLRAAGFTRFGLAFCVACIVTLSARAEGFDAPPQSCTSRQLVVIAIDVSKSMKKLDQFGKRTRWQAVCEDLQSSVSQLPTDGSTEVVLIVFADEVHMLPLSAISKQNFAGDGGKFQEFLHRNEFHLDIDLTKALVRTPIRPDKLSPEGKSALVAFAKQLATIDDPRGAGTQLYDALGLSLRAISTWSKGVVGGGDSEALLLVYSDGEQEGEPKWFFPQRSVQSGMPIPEVRNCKGNKAAADKLELLKSAVIRGRLFDPNAEVDDILRTGIPCAISSVLTGKDALIDLVVPLVRPMPPSTVTFSSAALDQRRARVHTEILQDKERMVPVDEAGAADLELDLMTCVFDPAGRVKGEHIRLSWQPDSSSATSDVQLSPQGLALQPGTTTQRVKIHISGAKGLVGGKPIVGSISLGLPKDSAEGDLRTKLITLSISNPKLRELPIATKQQAPVPVIGVLTGESVDFSVNPLDVAGTVIPELQYAWSLNGSPVLDASGGKVKIAFPEPAATGSPKVVSVTISKPGFEPVVFSWSVEVIDLVFEPAWEPTRLFVGDSVVLQPKSGGARKADASWSWFAGGVSLSEAKYRVATEQTAIGLSAQVGKFRLPFANGAYTPKEAAMTASPRPQIRIADDRARDALIAGKKFPISAQIVGDFREVDKVRWELLSEKGADLNLPSRDLQPADAASSTDFDAPKEAGEYKVRATLLGRDGKELGSDTAALRVRSASYALDASPPPSDAIKLAHGGTRSFQVALAGDLLGGERIRFEILDESRTRVAGPFDQQSNTALYELIGEAPSASIKRIVHATAIGKDGRPLKDRNNVDLVVEWSNVEVSPPRLEANIVGPAGVVLDRRIAYRLDRQLPADVEVQWSVQGGDASPSTAKGDECNVAFTNHTGPRAVRATIFRGGKELPKEQQPQPRDVDVMTDGITPEFSVKDNDDAEDDRALEDGGEITVTLDKKGQHIEVTGIHLLDPSNNTVSAQGPWKSDGITFHVPSKPVPAVYRLVYDWTEPAAAANVARTEHLGSPLKGGNVRNDTVSYTVHHAPDIKQGGTATLEVYRSGEPLKSAKGVDWSVSRVDENTKIPILVFKGHTDRTAAYACHFLWHGTYRIHAQLTGDAGDEIDVADEDVIIPQADLTIVVDDECLVGKPVNARLNCSVEGLLAKSTIEWSVTDADGKPVSGFAAPKGQDASEIPVTLPLEVAYMVTATIHYHLGDPDLPGIDVAIPVSKALTPRRPLNFVPIEIVFFLGGALLLVLGQLCRNVQDLRRVSIQWTALSPPEAGASAPTESRAAWDIGVLRRTIWLGATTQPYGGWKLRSFWSKRARIQVSSLWTLSRETEGTLNSVPEFRPPDWFMNPRDDIDPQLELRWEGDAVPMGEGSIGKRLGVNVRDGLDVHRLNDDSAMHSRAARICAVRENEELLVRVEYATEPAGPGLGDDVGVLHHLAWRLLRPALFWSAFVLWLVGLILAWSYR